MCWLKLCGGLAALSIALSLQAQPAQYQFVTPSEPLPDKPWHRTFIDEQARTPEGQPNAGAAWTDTFLQRAFDNTLQNRRVQQRKAG